MRLLAGGVLFFAQSLPPPAPAPTPAAATAPVLPKPLQALFRGDALMRDVVTRAAKLVDSA